MIIQTYGTQASSSMREASQSYQETRQISNNLALYPKQLQKEPKIQISKDPKLEKEIIKTRVWNTFDRSPKGPEMIKTEINEIEQKIGKKS